MEKEKNEKPQTATAGNERVEFKLAKAAKEQKFEATVKHHKMKKFVRTVLAVKLPNGYTKEINLDADEKGLLALNPPETKYVATFHEGFSAESGLPYIAVDVQIHRLVRKRDFLTWVEKVTLAENGLLTPAK